MKEMLVTAKVIEFNSSDWSFELSKWYKSFKKEKK